MDHAAGPSGAPLPPLGAHNQSLTELQQEALLRAKYGGLLPKKKLAPRDHKFFDSADWALSKQQQPGAPPQAPAPGPGHSLEPKLQPTQHPERRNSQLRHE